VACCVLGSIFNTCQADSSQEAVAAAKAYIERLKAGDYQQAVRDHWNTNVLLSATFGLTYIELPAAERTRAQAAFADFVAAPFANQGMTALFKNLVIKDATATLVNPSTVAVRLDIEGDAGRFQAQNTMLLVKTNDGWRIIDQRQGDQMSLRVALALTYVESRGENGTIPEALERAAAGVRKQAAAQ
jgi:hypothetical protein